jgi:hypothetical protein
MNDSRAGSWIERSSKRIFFDMHLPAWPDMGIASRFDPEGLAAAIADSGADSAVLYAKCQYGNFYTKLPGEQLHPGLGDLDLLEQLSERLHRRGLRTIAYYSVSWDEHIAAAHPEWHALNPAGAHAPGRWRTLCINGPYEQIVQKHLADIARKPIDGIWLDMTIIGEGNCYCPRCRERFRQDHHIDMPASPKEPGYEKALAFRYGIVEGFYSRVRQTIRSASPEVAFTNNYWGYPWSSTGMGSRALGSTTNADFLTGEAYSDWTGIRSTAILPVFLRSAAAGRPFESLIGTGINTWDYTRKPKPFLSYEAFSLFAHGATVTVDDLPFHDGSFDEALYREDLRDIFGAITSMAETTAGRHVRYASVYHSQRTKDLCRNPGNFIREMSGSFRLLHDLHLPVDFLFDESEAPLSPEEHPLIVLPGVDGLTGPEVLRLWAYMNAGGFIVASGSLGSDPEVMASLRGLGIEGGALSPYSLSYLRGIGPGSRDLLVRGNYTEYSGNAPDQGEVVTPVCETSPQRFFHNNLPAPYRATGTPGLLERKVGRGAFALFPQPVFRHYAKEPSAPMREAVGALIGRHVQPCPVGLTLPLKMDFAIVEADDTLYVHLLNPNVEPSLCCGPMEIYDGAFERSYEYMEEEAPVHDVRILVRSVRVTDVQTLREKSGVEFHETPEGCEIRIARVGLWEVVKIRIARGGR